MPLVFYLYHKNLVATKYYLWEKFICTMKIQMRRASRNLQCCTTRSLQLVISLFYKWLKGKEVKYIGLLGTFGKA